MNYVYVLTGFEVTKIYADRVFKPCQSVLAKIKLDLFVVTEAHTSTSQKGASDSSRSALGVYNQCYQKK